MANNIKKKKVTLIQILSKSSQAPNHIINMQFPSSQAGQGH